MNWIPEVILVFVLPAWFLYGILRFTFFRKSHTNFKVEGMRLGFIAYCILLFYIVWIASPIRLEWLPYNFIPFKTITQYFIDVSTGVLPFATALKNILGNLLLTVPIGILICLVYKRIKLIKLLIISITFPLMIELGQLVLHIVNYGTRIIDIDDIILNAIGIFIGYYISYLFLLLTQNNKNKSDLKQIVEN